jgi:2',3'-cyclic-nucleotide 2'-phosphodiesterase (5'-nucleotidase family)
MEMKRASRAMVAACLLALVLLMPSQTMAADTTQTQTTTLIILHTNDFHGALEPKVDKKIAPAPETVGGAAYLAGLIKKERAEWPSAVLLLDAGDVIPLPSGFDWKPVVNFKNISGYDAITLGNHDFDRGIPTLEKILKQVKSSVVCANVYFENGRPIPGVKPYVLKDVKGIRVGIIGLITPTTPTITSQGNVKGLVFEDPVPVVERYIPILKSKGARLIVVLSHLGEKEDMDLASRVEGIDVIVGGHSHTALMEPRLVNETLIVQAGSQGKYIGRMEIKMGPADTKMISYTGKNELIPIINKNITPDPEVLKIVESFKAQLAPLMEKVVGEALEDFSLIPASGCADSQMGNLVADSLREKTGSEVAFMNSGGIRVPINKGPIKMQLLYDISPFENYVSCLDMTGADILAILEHGLSSKMKSFVQVSGMEVVYNPGKPDGSRVVEALVGGKKLEPEKVYRVTTIDFLVNGGDGFTAFAKGKNRADREMARNVLEDYVRAHSPMKPAPTGRIRQVQ